ncbi:MULTISPECIES: MDR family MFS transporter [Protofrankia]|uniref:Drug resistance transporter, EmrB/QacA subfamily n=1 Tax=Candidatus Protofrankia datiscae TaxID=2716812 RepID=F8AXT5_9ACTN|nr:drug resistance transporter, EmrB/QacA subfamily [Candidatus Protofrankia datiscae]
MAEPQASTASGRPNELNKPNGPREPKRAGADRLDPALIRLAGIILVGAVVVQLDTTIIAVAIDTLGRSFNVGISTIQWVSTGYMLALAMVIPLTGWSVERFGGKRMWILSLALFLVGSALCGSAWSAGSLIAFRVMQGIGGGMLLPLMQTLLAQAAGPQRLGRLMATVAVPALVTPILGPVIGGVILDNLSWRWIFFINVPICLIALLLAWRGMPDVRTPGRHPLDVLGLALLSPALAAVVYGFSEAGSRGSFADANASVPLIAGVVLLVLFTVHSMRVAIEPIIDLRMFRSRAFTGSAAMMFLFGISLFGAMLLLPLYEQQVRGRSAAGAGLLLAPQGLGMMITMVVVGKLTDRGSTRLLVLTGLLLSVLGTAAYTQVGTDTSEWLLGLSLAVRGAGLAAALIPVMTAVYQGLRRDEIPRATSAVRIFQQIGGSLGTAVLAVVLSQGIADRGGAGQVDAAGLADAFGNTFWWTLAFTAVAVPFAFLMPGRKTAAPARAAVPAQAAGLAQPTGPAGPTSPADAAGPGDIDLLPGVARTAAAPSPGLNEG